MFPSKLTSTESITFYFDSMLSPSQALYITLDELHQTKIKVTYINDEFIGTYDLACNRITKENNIIYFMEV